MKKTTYQKWYIKNRAKRIAQIREWQKDKKERTRAYFRKWYANNKDYHKQWYLDRKAAKQAAEQEIKDAA